jgi:Kef-type K+ transport system membrane component KefB/Trk K+ transport system NAD-binding subunit
MEEESFYQLLLISGLAVLVPVVATRVPARVLPALVGEIIAGIIIGTSGLNLIDPTPVLDFLAEFGFAYLMFLSGLELDPHLLTAASGAPYRGLKTRLSSPLGSGLVILGGTLAIAFFGVAILELSGLAPDLWLTTLILSTTSVGVVVPTLKERGLAARPYGQVLLVAAFLADLVTLVLIGAFAAVKREGPNVELALILALPIAFLLVYRLGATLARHRIVSRTVEELAHATAQVQVRGALALMLAFVVFAKTIGSELILGSFVAGVIVSLLSPEEGTSLRMKLDAIGYGFFIPIFFINVGANLDLGALSGSAEDLSLLPIFLAIGYMSKVVPSLVLRLRFSWQETLAGGFLLSSRLSLIIAASLIGQELGIITAGVNSAIIIVAVVTSSLSPMVFSRLMQMPAQEAGAVIIVGAGETGRSLASRLSAHGSGVVLIEHDDEAGEEARRDGLSVVQGRGDRLSVLREAGIESASALVAVTPDDAYNLRVCKLAKQRFGVSQLAARVSDPNNRGDFIRAGIRGVAVPLSTSAALENAVLRPNLFQVLVDRPKEYDVLEVTLRNHDLVGKRLRDIRLPGNCLVLLIRRDGELVTPRGSTVLQDWDSLTLAGDRDSVLETVQLLQPRRGK